MLTRKLSLFLSSLVISGLIVSGCGQAVPVAAPPSAPVVAPVEAPVDSAKLIQDAVATYMKAPAGAILNDKLKSELEKTPDSYFVLDIRKADDYAKGHIKGAVNVPFGPELANNLDKIRAAAQGKTFVVTCYTGQTAGQTVSALNIAGVKAISLQFGMGKDGFLQGWMAKKYPMVTDATPMPDAPAVPSPNKVLDQAFKDFFTNLPADSYQVTQQILKEAIDKKTADLDYFIVDIRSAADFAKGHIQGAINVPYGPDVATNLDMIKEKGKGKTVVVYCYTGQTGGQVDSLLNMMGVKTRSLAFGFGKEGDNNKGWSVTYPDAIVK